jgi:type I restriction enzyme, S subunit
MKYKKYPKYKDSGVEWIGEIPEGWEVKKLKYSVDLYSKKSNGNTKERPYVGLENIESKTGRLIPDFSTEFEGDSKEFESGDVLFGKLRPYLAKAILTDFSGKCSGEILVFRGNKIKSELLHHIVLSDGFIQIVNSSTYGAKMPRAEWSMIGNILVPISPEKEQNEIYNFLEKQTTQFDELIAKSKAQITLLEEKRQALITATVTGKIDVRNMVA